MAKESKKYSKEFKVEAKKKYNEGQWFAIPLKNGGYAIGIIVRGCYKTKGGLGYFFGPRYQTIPCGEDTYKCHKDNSILVNWFGDLGIINGEWPLIENGQPFAREKWPIPIFWREITLHKQEATLVEYDQNDPGSQIPIREYVVSITADQLNYPEDVLSGYVAIEIKLENKLKKP